MDARDLRIALAEFELTQAQLARILGKSPGRVTAWAGAGKMPVEVRLFFRLARACGIEAAKEAARP